MKSLIRNRDLKTLVFGAAFAVALGLVAGAAMEPNLAVGDGPQGPQILAGESARRGTADENPYAVYAAYTGALPEYVVGSDWTKPAVADAPAYPDTPISEEAAATGDATPAYAQLATTAPTAGPVAAPVAAVAPLAPVAPDANGRAEQDDAELAELAAATPG